MCAAPQRALHTPYSDPKPRTPSREALDVTLTSGPWWPRLSKLRLDTRMAAWHGPPVAATGHSTACASWSAQVLRSSDVDASQSDAFDRPMRARARAQNARLCAFGAAAPPARGAARRVDEHTRPESGALLRRADAQRGREEEVCPRTSATAFLRSYYGEGTLRQLSDTRTRHSRGTLSPMRAYASRSNSTSLASARTTASQLWAPANECQVGAPGGAAESLRGA